MSHYLDAAAGVVALLNHLYLHGDVGFHLVNMTDYSHMAAALAVKGAQGGDGIGERLAAESAETLVDEEGVNRECVANVGKGEGKGKRDEETLAATERVGAAGGKTLIRVFKRDVERAWNSFKCVSRGKTLEIGIGRVEQTAEDVALCNLLEFGAVGITDICVHTLPSIVFLACFLSFLPQFLGSRLFYLVVIESLLLGPIVLVEHADIFG